MRIKGIIDEDFVNYKQPAMFIAMPFCNWKCETEAGCKMCQNSKLANEPTLDIEKTKILQRYLNNPISQAIVFGGLEPLDSLTELDACIDCLRRDFHCNDTVVIYTGYTEKEAATGKINGFSPEVAISIWNDILNMGNIIVKYGRYVPHQEKHVDKILGVVLASPNQYAKLYD